MLQNMQIFLSSGLARYDSVEGMFGAALVCIGIMYICVAWHMRQLEKELT